MIIVFVSYLNNNNKKLIILFTDPVIYYYSNNKLCHHKILHASKLNCISVLIQQCEHTHVVSIIYKREKAI